MAQYDTVGNILSAVATELGLGGGGISFTSTNENVLRLIKLLEATGRGLVLRYPWLQQKVDYSFVTTTATTYDLPAAFNSYVDGTAWNRTSKQPLVPVSPQQWEAMVASGVTTAMPVIFRTGVATTAAGLPTLELITAPTAGQTIALQYRSRLWVRPSSGTYTDSLSATTDVVRFDGHLASRATKVAWLEALGLDSTAARQDLQEVLDAVRGHNVQTAPVLSMSGPLRGLPLPNVPETGFGT